MEKDTKNQWKLILWRMKQESQTFSQTSQQKQGKTHAGDEKGAITTDTSFRRSLCITLKNIYSNKLKNIKEMDEFLDALWPTKVNQNEIIFN